MLTNIITSINISQNDKDFISENSINLSHFVRKKLAELKKKRIDIDPN